MMRHLPVLSIALVAQLVPGTCAPSLTDLVETIDPLTMRALEESPQDDPGGLVGQLLGMTPAGPVPLVEALVQLRQSGHVLRETRTNREGRYELPDVRPGEYGLHASAEGYEPQGARVVVESGQTTRQGFMLRPVAPPGAIVGHVIGMTRAGPIPLAEALVQLRRAGRVVRETRSNHEGRFELLEVRAAEYGLHARAEGFQPQGAPVRVEPGRTTRRGFLLYPAPPPGALAGRVMGLTPAGPAPLGDALVQLRHAGHLVRETRTNHEGLYELPDVRPGEYGLTARAEGFQPQGARVVVESGQTTRQPFLLHPLLPPGAITGRVMGATPGGPNPLADARVQLLRDGRILRETHTNREGVYEMPEVPPGEYGLVAHARGFQPQGVRVTVESGHTTHQGFLLQPQLQAGAIAGRVMGMTPAGPVPLAEALVQLLRDGHVLRETHTNREGVYELAEVPPGEYGMLATARGYQPERAHVVVESGQTTRQAFLLDPLREDAPSAIATVDGSSVGFATVTS